MKISTRLYCTLQQLCCILLVMGPFWYLSMNWIAQYGPLPSVSSVWDIFSLSLMFFGLLLFVDDVCTWLNNEFKMEK